MPYNILQPNIPFLVVQDADIVKKDIIDKSLDVLEHQINDEPISPEINMDQIKDAFGMKFFESPNLIPQYLDRCSQQDEQQQMNNFLSKFEILYKKSNINEILITDDGKTCFILFYKKFLEIMPFQNDCRMKSDSIINLVEYFKIASKQEVFYQDLTMRPGVPGTIFIFNRCYKQLQIVRVFYENENWNISSKSDLIISTSQQIELKQIDQSKIMICTDRIYCLEFCNGIYTISDIIVDITGSLFQFNDYLKLNYVVQNEQTIKVYSQDYEQVQQLNPCSDNIIQIHIRKNNELVLVCLRKLVIYKFIQGKYELITKIAQQQSITETIMIGEKIAIKTNNCFYVLLTEVTPYSKQIIDQSDQIQKSYIYNNQSKFLYRLFKGVGIERLKMDLEYQKSMIN